MQRIEFSEMTNRLHRNLMVSASLIVAITYFNIEIRKASNSGVDFENLTTRAVLLSLIAILIYHAGAFCIRAFEEYREWELKLTDKNATAFGGGVFDVDLAEQMYNVGDLLIKILRNGGAISRNNQEIISAEEAAQLKDAGASARIYGKRFSNFPKITRFRFWVWDIGMTGIITSVAVFFGLSALWKF